MASSNAPGPGGFMPPSLPSPAPPSASSTQSIAGLPQPRSRSLLPGSNKEDLLRRYVEERLVHIARSFVKKHMNPSAPTTRDGYSNFGDVCRDLDASENTLNEKTQATLQIPFLLRIGSEFTGYVKAFPPAPRATFALLRKLDHCFASLLQGKDIKTDEALPGFENGLRSGMSTTDMVRCRSLVEQTRVLMVEVMTQDEEEDEGTNAGDETDDSMQDNNGLSEWDMDEDEDEEEMHLDTARIYEHTIVKLGERLGDSLTPAMRSDD